MIRALNRPLADDTNAAPCAGLSAESSAESSRSASPGAPAPATLPEARSPVELLESSLQQLADLLVAVSDAQYVLKPVGVIPSSLGGHVRHCLDHFAAFCRGVESGCMDYDDRQRGTPVETSRAAALAAIAALQARLRPLQGAPLSMSVRVQSVVSADGRLIETASSLGRELVFVLSHTVHHNALLAAICHTLGVPVPERFGYAPATITELDRLAHAQSPSGS